MVFRYELINKETKELLATFSSPFDKEQAKQQADITAEMMLKINGVECEVIENG